MLMTAANIVTWWPYTHMTQNSSMMGIAWQTIVEMTASMSHLHGDVWHLTFRLITNAVLMIYWIVDASAEDNQLHHSV